MIKWIVKRYLMKRYEQLEYDILSLEQELGYADYIKPEEEIRLITAHKETIYDKNNLEHVINNVI